MLGPFVFDDSGDFSMAPLVHSSHNMGLVLLSIGVAFISCCAAFYMGHTNRSTTALGHRKIASLCASLVLGWGIWAMHFIGMLALEIPTPVSYDVLGTTLSILPGMLVAWWALVSLHMHKPSTARILRSGALVGMGIAATHYSGIAAMQMEGRMLFHLPLFLWSAVLGVVLSMLSVMVQRWIDHRRSQNLGWYVWLMPPAILTLGIASMHYVSMHALRIELDDANGQLLEHLSQIGRDHMLPWAVAAMSAVVFVILGLANALLRYRDLWQALAARDARLNAMIDTADVGFISIDAQGIIQDFNSSAQRIFGYAKTEVIGRNVAMLMPSPLAEQHDGHLARHIGKPGKTIGEKQREVLGLHKDGRHLPLQLSIGKAITPAGTLFVGYVQDLSTSKRRDAQLRIAASVFHHVREGVAIVDANHNISDVNPAFLRLMEKNKEQCVGKSLEQLYENADLPPNMSKLWQTVATQQYWQGEIMFTRKDGKVWIQRLSLSPVLNELQRPHHFIAVISDVTERQGLEMLLAHADLHDSATGLPTRQLFMERLNGTLLTARRNSIQVGVVVVKALPVKGPSVYPSPSDLDGALRLLAQLLQHQLRSGDTLARTGKDELTLLLPGIKDAPAFATLVQRFWQSVKEAPEGYSKYGIHSLQLGQALTLPTHLTASELMDEALATLQTWPTDHNPHRVRTR